MMIPFFYCKFATVNPKDNFQMNIETTRLNLYPISDVRLRHLIEIEEDDAMRQALTEMLQGCTDFPCERMWYALWQMAAGGIRPLHHLTA